MPVFYPNPVAVEDVDGTRTMPFVIRRDPIQSVILVSMRGFWDIETVDAYTTALDTVVNTVTASGIPFGMLIDCADYPVQSLEATRRFTDWCEAWPAPYRKDIFGIAIIAASVLNKLQAERAFGLDVSVFLDRSSALRWLDERNPKACVTMDYISPR